MKQHMLTHKIRDMPQHMFGSPTGSGSGAPSAASGDSRSGRRSADYQESGEKMSRRSLEESPNSNNNNNNQREKNHNTMEGKLKNEAGMKRPLSNDNNDESIQAKRPLSE